MLEVKFEGSIEYKYMTDLVLYYDNKEIFRESDGIDLEDHYFHRGFIWVKSAIEKAYELGFEDGHGVGANSIIPQ